MPARQVVVAVVSALVLAGCTNALLPVHHPGTPGTAVPPPVSTWNAWIVHSWGCGFCEGDVRDFHVTVLWTDGTVLTAWYGHSGIHAPQVTYSEEASPWKALLDPLFAGTTLYGEHSGGTTADRGIHASEVKVARLAPEDADAIRRVVDRGLDGRREPRSEGITLDCGETIVEQWREGAPLRRAEIHCSHDDGGGWGRIAEQMYALHEWLR